MNSIEITAKQAYRIEHGARAIGDEAALLDLIARSPRGWETSTLNFHWTVRQACNKMGWIGRNGRLTKTGRAALAQVLVA